jgi:hypothetical protein
MTNCYCKREVSASEFFRSKSEETRGVDVLCIQARDETDEIVGMFLARALERQGNRALSIPIATTAEMLSQVAVPKPGVVCISALPPFAVDHARALYAELRTLSRNLHIVYFEGDLQNGTN